MKPLPLINFITILLIISLTHSYAEGFEVKGFKMGMSIEEARLVAEEHGKKLLEGKYFYAVGGDMLYFCKNKLTQLSYAVSSGFMSFTKQMRNFISEGFKIINVLPRTQIAYDGKEMVDLEVHLREVGKNWHIQMTLFGIEGIGVKSYQIDYVDSIGPVICK